MFVHHLAATFGCLYCFYVPVGKGLVTLNCLVAHIGSGLYSCYSLRPTLFWTWVYVLGMTLSNFICAFNGFKYQALRAARHETATVYMVLLAVLVVLREIPVIQVCVDWIATRFRTKVD
jgi:hypothetical protein